jgi:hypothetical protein
MPCRAPTTCRRSDYLANADRRKPARRQGAGQAGCMAAPRTIINAILDALAPLGAGMSICLLLRADLARDPQRAPATINAVKPDALRVGGGSQPKTVRPPLTCESRRS